MLEQPPERSQWEIDAEIAASAQQLAPPSRAQGCFRLILWCSPVFVVLILVVLLNSLPSRLWMQSYFAPQLLSIPLSLAAIYGIGYFDGLLSRKTFAAQEGERRRNVRWHALIFLAWQFLIIPGICILFYGACFLVFSMSTR